MYPPAHLAVSLFLTGACRADRPSALAATIFPDLVDKSLAWLLGAAPSARYVAHSLPAVALSSGLVAALGGRRRGLSFGASYLTHLLCDLWEGGHVPWLMPFKRYGHIDQPWRLRISTRGLLLEIVALLLLIRFALARPDRSAGGASSPARPSSMEAPFR